MRGTAVVRMCLSEFQAMGYSTYRSVPTSRTVGDVCRWQDAAVISAWDSLVGPAYPHSLDRLSGDFRGFCSRVTISRFWFVGFSYAHQHSTLTHILTHSHTHTPALTHSRTHALTHSRTHALTHSRTHSRTHAPQTVTTTAASLSTPR